VVGTIAAVGKDCMRRWKYLKKLYKANLGIGKK
jgi:hypothetical protein